MKIKGLSGWEGFNARGMTALARKEIVRFIKVYTQTIIAPVSTTVLFYLIFAFAFGAEGRVVAMPTGNVAFLAFLAPGLIMMNMAQNAFANTSSSLVLSKIQGNIVDVLLPPLSPLELGSAYIIGGIARGLAVGAAAIAVMIWIAPIAVHSIFFILFHAIAGSMMLALIGLAAGIWADKFDHIAAVTNFIVMPATFLSGTFYSAQQLPGAWSLICHLNPFFYMIDGFRYGFIGVSDGTLSIGIAVMILMNALLAFFVFRMLASGYKLKS